MDDEKIIDLKDFLCYPLRGHESYFNWVGKKFDQEVAKSRLQKIKCARNCQSTKDCEFCSFDGEWRSNVEPKLFLENDDDDDDDDEINSESFLHYFVCWYGEMVFLEAFIGEHEKAETLLNYLNCAIEYSESESMDGYKYICKTLQAFINFSKASIALSEIGSVQDFSSLSQQAQIGVLSLKFVFHKEIKETFKSQVNILRKLIELDPKNPVWHEQLGLRLRLLKKDLLQYGHGMKPPTLEENHCFATAYNLRPDVPKFFASFARNIAEMLKARRYNTFDQPIKVNVQNQSIETVGDALDFLKNYTRFLLDVAETFKSKAEIAKTITTMGEVFSVSLPKPFQDHDLAEECIATAVQLSPSCSKANHRMGIFQWLKRNDYDSALEYLTAAVGCKNENFYAIVDWISLLICKVDQNSDILMEIFEEILSTDYFWKPVEEARFTFLKGCFLFTIPGKKKATIDCWIRAYELHKMCHFQMTFMDVVRFGWEAFQKDKILKLLSSSKRSSYPVVKKMIYELRKGDTQPKLIPKVDLHAKKMIHEVRDENTQPKSTEVDSEEN